MSAQCDHHHTKAAQVGNDPSYRRALWIALVANAAMFFIEVFAGWQADSASLLADAIDFAGDAANYGIAIWVLTATNRWRSRSALLKGISMLAFGIFVLGRAVWLAAHGAVPAAETMGLVGLLALLVNIAVALMLYRWRNGDASMRSVWLCTRNDAIGNLAIIASAAVVWATGHGFADVAVAIFMGALAIWSGKEVIALSRRELAEADTLKNTKL